MGGDLTLYVTGNPLPGYLSVPTSPAPWPGVVVIHQAYGLDDDIRRITDRVGALGYLAVAPDLVETGRLRCLAGIFLDLARGRGPSVEKAGSVVEWVRSRSDCSGQVGVLGFCTGGGIAYLLGATGKVQAIAPNYGLAAPDELLMRSCPVVASYGGRDRLFARQARRAARALAVAGIDHDIKVYANAGHSFMNQAEGHRLTEALSRPLLAVAYDRTSAEDAWARIEAFFAQHLH